MRTVVTNVRILGSDAWPPLSHIVIEGGTIGAIIPGGTEPPEGDVRFDAEEALAVPGFFNSHAHNHEIYMKGRLYGLPLEPYILYVSPRNPTRKGLSPEQLYVRTLATCAEMLRNGVTGVADDYSHISLDREDIEAVLGAYQDSGMRARVSVVVEDSPWSRSVPYRDEGLRSHPRLDAVKNDPATALACYGELVTDWGADRRVGLMVSPSAPQRCSPEFLEQLVRFARTHGLPFHVHIQETLSQYIVGPKLFEGRSMIRFMAESGFLGPETTIAHAVWIDDDDLGLIAGSGANVVHNPVSNMKLGSGVARAREMLDAGINVTLGTDGLTCNDALDMFEVSKTAALLSCVASTDPRDWLGPREILSMGSLGGARANLYPNVGEIAIGQRADITFIDPMSFALIPPNDAAAQAVFSVRSGDVAHVMVEGKLVVKDGKCLTVDAKKAHAAVRSAAEEYWAEAEPTIADNLELLNGVDQAYLEAVRELTTKNLFRLVPATSKR